MKLFRILIVAVLGATLPFGALAQGKLEKTKVSVAVGGKSAFYYLPLTIAERRSEEGGSDVPATIDAGSF